MELSLERAAVFCYSGTHLLPRRQVRIHLSGSTVPVDLSRPADHLIRGIPLGRNYDYHLDALAGQICHRPGG